MRSKSLKTLVLGALIVVTAAFAAGGEQPAERSDVDFTFNQRIPMRDGVELAAYIWKPAEMEGPLPAIFSLSPYTIEMAYKEGPYMASHGYVYLLVDVRGRSNSDGEFWPWENDGRDGADVVEWIARQPWCDGQVGMIGGSYRGTTQWLTLKQMPPHLKTIIPTASAWPGLDFPGIGSIRYAYFAQWLGFVSGVSHNLQYFSDAEYWTDKFYQMYSEHIPFSHLPDLVATNRRVFDKWIGDPSFDDFWRSFTPTPDEFARFDIPILTITGYFDGDQPGALQYYREHMKYGNDEAKRMHHLIIGPWDHAGTRMNKEELGGLTFGPNAVVFPDMIELYVQWFDWTLKGKDRPEFLKDRVAYYVVNRDEWRYVDDWTKISNGTESFYLSSTHGGATDVFHSGSLVPNPPASGQQPDVFTYDPLKLKPKADPSEAATDPFLDQRLAFSDDILIYHSRPLEDDIEMAGTVRLEAYIELDVPDTDLLVQLFEITQKGVSIDLGNAMMRARYRNSPATPELVVPGEINLYDIPLYLFHVRTLDRGSRLRLVVTSVNTPEFEKNYNSGGVVAEESAADARTATIKLHHDERHPSRLVLPVKR